MKRLLLSVALATVMLACKKDNKTCYECNFDGSGYQNVGCYTPDEWRDMQFSDQYGQPYDKAGKCRKQ